MNNVMTWGVIGAMLIAGGVMGASIMDLHTPIPVQVGAVTVSVTKSDAIEACRNMADSAFVQQMGGVKADSPCGKLLGL